MADGKIKIEVDTEEADKWLSSVLWRQCSDELPEPGERVIATNGSFVGEFFLMQSGEWRRYDGLDWYWANNVAITHWMPFPQTPKT